MSFKPHPHVPIRINGVRNQVAPFKSRVGVLKVGAMGAIEALGDASVLLTAETDSGKPGETIDVEIAIPVSMIEQVMVKSLFLCECLTREHRVRVVHAAAA